MIKVLPSPVKSRGKVQPQVLPQNAITEKEITQIHASKSMSKLTKIEKMANKGLEENIIKVRIINFIMLLLPIRIILILISDIRN